MPGKFASTPISKVYAFIENTRFFVVSLALLIIQSLWLTFSAVYPLPFDEYYHVGLIQIYSKQWLPFITDQSETMGLYGDITRMPSYLYHYLMSFPYRLLDIFIDNQAVLIIGLRIINIAMVIGAIMLFRRLFLQSGISKRIIHVAILIFILTPIVPFLTSHVNYDNLMLLLTPVVLGSAYRIVSKKQLDIKTLFTFVSVGSLAILVKHNFLPIFLILGAFIFVWLVRNRKELEFHNISKQLKGFSKLQIAIVCCLLISVLGLAIERYGGNIAVYGSVRPRCEQVQTTEVCKNYSPWYRTYRTKILKSQTGGAYYYGNPISFTQHWNTVMLRGYFAVFSHTPSVVSNWYEPFGPIITRPILPLPIFAASIWLTAGLAAIFIQLRHILTNKFLKFSFFLTAGYLLVLWGYNYRGYLVLGDAQAIQARYTYPLMLIILVLIISAVSFFSISSKVKTLIFCSSVFLYILGGGITGWMIRSDTLWYWPNVTVNSINQSAQQTLKKVIPH